MPLTVSVEVPPRDREVLESWLRAPSMPAGVVRRARIVLLAADEGGANPAIPTASASPAESSGRSGFTKRSDRW
jgi:hypothetical protein